MTAMPIRRINDDKKSFPTLPDDEERVAALFAPFRMRSVNSEHYDAKMKFWEEIIAQYCEYKGEASFTQHEIQTKFMRGDRLPACLHDVVADLLQTKKIRSRVEYEYDPMNSWTGWALNSFVRKPFSWSVTKIKSSVGMTDVSAQNSLVQYVFLSVIQNFCKLLQTKVLQPSQGKLLHFDAFRELCENVGLELTEDCLRLVLHTLHRQYKIGLEYKDEHNERRIHLIKIPAQGQANVIITEADRAVHNLQMTQANLLKQLESIEQDIRINENKAREYLKENKRQLAKTYLRKKQLLEKNHEKRSVALHNIEMLLSSVDEAHSNGDILDAYKIGTKALQNALNSSGLKYDNVDEVIAEVRDSMDAHKEVQDALGNISVNEDLGLYDNDELERELEDILGDPTITTPLPVNKVKPITPIQPINSGSNVNNNSNIKENIRIVPTMVSSNNNNNQTATVTITDADLLAMLEDLEVEDNSIKSDSQSEHNNSSETTTH